MDICGLPTPGHVQGKSIRTLLADPNAEWAQPGVSTFLRNNHAVRSEGWRYIRYADGSEELYNEQTDPLEYTNLAKDPKYAGTKQELAKWLPKTDAKDLPGGKGGGEGESGGKRAAKKAKQNKQ
jgi:arylsulfatase A-like enzyme